jgi:phosphatidylglycerophosphate synthase
MYSYQQILKSTKPSDSWIGTFLINPLSYPLVYFLANKTTLRPEIINLSSLIVGISAAFFFLKGAPGDLLMASSLVILSYTLDGTDGKLARLKNQVTGFGTALEAIRDKIVHLSCFFALTIGQFTLTHDFRIFHLSAAYLLLLIINSLVSFISLRKKGYPFFGALASIRALEVLPKINFAGKSLYPSPSITEALFILFIGTPFLGLIPSLVLATSIQLYMIIFLLISLRRKSINNP